MKPLIYILYCFLILKSYAIENSNRCFVKNEAVTKYLNTNPNTIHLSFDALLKKHVSANGNVNYKAFKKDHKLLKSYIKTLGNNVPKTSDSSSKKIAFWINAYNALTIDVILQNYPIKSIKAIKNPWRKKLWKLGKTWYNLNDIEHNILRKLNEPRIHFAIVCASVSCPKLSNCVYTSLNLETQLTKATKAFLADASKNKITKNELQLSKIFKWFKKDFEKNNGNLINFINQYTKITILSKAKIKYLKYNWNLNE